METPEIMTDAGPAEPNNMVDVEPETATVEETAPGEDVSGVSDPLAEAASSETKTSGKKKSAKHSKRTKVKRIAKKPERRHTASMEKKKKPAKIERKGGMIGIGVSTETAKSIRRLRAALEIKTGDRVTISEAVAYAVKQAMPK